MESLHVVCANLFIDHWVLQNDLMLPTTSLIWLWSVLEFGYINTIYARFEIFMALLLRVKVVWNVTLHWRVVLKVSKDRSAFTFRIKQSELTLKINFTWPFETSGNSRQTPRLLSQKSWILDWSTLNDYFMLLKYMYTQLYSIGKGKSVPLQAQGAQRVPGS